MSNDLVAGECSSRDVAPPPAASAAAAAAPAVAAAAVASAAPRRRGQRGDRAVLTEEVMRNQEALHAGRQQINALLHVKQDIQPLSA